MSQNLGLFGFGNDFNKVTCPDGKVRFVLKKVTDMGKAFSLWLPEVNFRFNASIKAIQSTAEGTASADYGKKAEQVLKDIDELHIDAVEKFGAAYITYMGNA